MGFISRIKNTQRVAQSKGIPTIFLPMFDALMISFVISWAMFYGSLLILNDFDNTSTHSPWYVSGLYSIFEYTLLVYYGLIIYFLLDKFLLLTIAYQAFIIKQVYKLLHYIDNYLWRKTKRDSVLINKVWKIENKIFDKNYKIPILFTVIFVFVIFFVIRFEVII